MLSRSRKAVAEISFATRYLHTGVLASESFSGPSPINDDTPTAVIIHGLLGQGKNWRTFSKRFASEAEKVSNTPWRVLTLDLRCHGESAKVAGLEEPHTMARSAQDILTFVQQKLRGRGPEIVAGHSMGGKVALEYLQQVTAADCHVARPKALWVLDSQPGLVAADLVPDVSRVLQAVMEVPLPVANRPEFVSAMKKKGFSEPLVQWMASNLVPIEAATPGAGLTWAFDVQGASDMYVSYRETSYWSLLAAPPAGVSVNVLRADASDRWNPGMIAQLRECTAAAAMGGGGETAEHVLQGAGHWVHMDQPDKLREMMLQSVRCMTSR